MRDYTSLTRAVENMMTDVRLPHAVRARKEANRRYGMIFTNLPDLGACMLGDEDKRRSTWEYRAPTCAASSHTCGRVGPTPAQEIARSCRFAWSFESTVDSDESDTTAYSSDEVSDSDIEVFGERVRYRQSRYEELTLVVSSLHTPSLSSNAIIPPRNKKPAPK